MTESQQYELNVLNELIVTTLKRAQDYKDAAKSTDAPLAIDFAKRAREHFEAAGKLQDRVKVLQEKAGARSQFLSAAYAVLIGRNELGFDDEWIERRFEKALRDIRISDLVRSIIYAAHACIGDRTWLQKSPGTVNI